MLSYFVNVIITVQLASCFTGLDSTKQAKSVDNLNVTKLLHPNQSVTIVFDPKKQRNNEANMGYKKTK